VSALVEKTLVSTVLFVVSVSVFFAAGALTPKHVQVAWLATRWDASIPLVPPAVWFYLSWYLAPWLVLAAPQRDFRRIASAILLAFIICAIGYVLLPVALGRPLVAGRTLSERALRFLYDHDPPWNVFPSFHAAVCAVLWRPGFGRAFVRMVFPVWMSSICVACVLTKQHNLLDVVAGLLVGLVALPAATAVLHSLDRGRLIVLRPASRESRLPMAGTAAER